MKLKPPRVGEILAGAFGALLLASLFLPWYRTSLVCVPAPCPQAGATAFQAFAVLDVFLVVVAFGGIALVALEIYQRSLAVTVAWSALAALIGLVATALVLWRTLDPPAGTGGEPVFAFLGLAACVGLTAGCFLSMRDEGLARSAAQGASRGTDPDPIAVPSGLPNDGPGERR